MTTQPGSSLERDGSQRPSAEDIPPIGIDLGTTNSCAAIYRNGRVEEVPDRDGKRVTPSYVAFTYDELTDETVPLVGHAAAELRNDHPEAQYVIFDAKRLLGKLASDIFSESSPDYESFTRLRHYWPFELAAGDNDTLQIVVPIEDEESGELIRIEKYTPLQISTAVLRRLREDTEDLLGVERGAVRRAVIAHPAYFDRDQRAHTLEAARLAGFTEIVDEGFFVSEPTAALLAYHAIERDGSDMDLYRALVFDLGAGTFDVTVVEADGNTLSQLAIGGDNMLGGRDFDHTLFELVKGRLERAFGRGCLADATDQQQLLRECEQIKISLSDRANINLESHLIEALPDQPLTGLAPQQLRDLTSLSRREYEDACEPLLERIFDATRRALNDTTVGNGPPKEINEVILVGAATHMPMVRSRLKRMFPGKLIDRRLDASRAVAFGAAIRAAKLFQAREAPNIECIEVIPLSLGVSFWGNRFKPVLPRNTPYGKSGRECFITTINNQTSMFFDIYEGERKLANHNRYLNRVTLTGLPGGLPAGGASIEVVFELRASGQLTVRVKCIQNGAHTQLNFDYKSIRASRDTQERRIAEAEVTANSDQQEFDRLTKKGALDIAIRKEQFECQNSQPALSDAEKAHKRVVCERYSGWLEENPQAGGALYDAKLTAFRAECRKRPHSTTNDEQQQGGEEGSEDESVE